jgi:alpha-tubulin suppressor-like RCC1 family protein
MGVFSGGWLIGLSACFCACNGQSPAEVVGAAKQRIIFGEDDRNEVGTSSGYASVARSVAALIPTEKLIPNESGYQVNAATLGESFSLCAGERFADQPTAAHCGAVLISPDVVLTAGHCVGPETCGNYRFVFGYEISSISNGLNVAETDVYGCAEVLSRNTGDLDFALVRLDRSVSNRPTITVPAIPSVVDDVELTLFSHPSGLPLKVSSSGYVTDVRRDIGDYFAAKIDAFPGSSGAPVFNAKSGALAGVLVRGPTVSYVFDSVGQCYRAAVVPEDHSFEIDVVHGSAVLANYCANNSASGLCHCGNGTCDTAQGETTLTCPVDCGQSCGDGFCGVNENGSNCYVDCGSCGNGSCENLEIARMDCCEDCGCPSGYACGDGACKAVAGNVNGDSSIDEKDLSDLEQTLNGSVSSVSLTCGADVTGDGNIDIADAAHLTEYLNQVASGFPAESLNGLGLGFSHTCALEGTEVRCWGDNRLLQLNRMHPLQPLTGAPSAAHAIALSLGAPVVALSVGANHTCAIDDRGRVFCWGDNRLGQLGQSRPRGGRAEWMQLESPVTQVVTGSGHTCALLRKGSVHCWGSNQFGELGVPGANFAARDATAVALGETVREIAAGTSHTCALLESGSIRCWGLNMFGQLGLGNKLNVGDNEEPVSLPVVSVGGNALSIRAGGSVSCATLEGGSTRCWGSNLFGQLGNSVRGSIGDNELPSDVAPLSFAEPSLDLQIGETHACASFENGKLLCWGLNSAGQLGGVPSPLPRTIAQSIPLSFGDIRKLRLGSQHTCVVVGPRDLRCWGNNGSGQLGVPSNEITRGLSVSVPIFDSPDLGWHLIEEGLNVWAMRESQDAQSTVVALFVENVTPASTLLGRAYYTLTTAESPNSVFAIQDHYTPWSTPQIISRTPIISLEYDFQGRALSPGERTSWGMHGGEKARYHFEDWRTSWDARNDYSASELGQSWRRTARIQLVDVSGRVVSGWSRPVSP